MLRDIKLKKMKPLLLFDNIGSYFHEPFGLRYEGLIDNK